jgi:hypothetical protein
MQFKYHRSMSVQSFTEIMKKLKTKWSSEFKPFKDRRSIQLSPVNSCWPLPAQSFLVRAPTIFLFFQTSMCFEIGPPVRQEQR